MRSAFRRGVELLSEPELDSVQSQGQRSKAAPKNMKGINGVPKNATQLKPVIDKLMQRVIAIANYAIQPVSANST
jgi:hypothetical protein